MGTVSYESGRFKNTVLHQSINPGKSVKKGSAVDMVVSNGMGKKRVTVPDIIGLELTKAVQKLRRRHLRIGQIQFDSTKKADPDIILDYSPKVKKITEGKSLNLVVSEPSGAKKQKESRTVLDSVLTSPSDSSKQLNSH
jgi:beta-lactam-binding protein with PASTA domain